MQPLQMWLIPVPRGCNLAGPADLMASERCQHIRETRPGLTTPLWRFDILQRLEGMGILAHRIQHASGRGWPHAWQKLQHPKARNAVARVLGKAQ